ncbi:Tuberous sclerosis 2-like protein [Lithohypha guttulata]|uniref:Tuberous sclerosis 2-like protein n=1 Tax=Lithohypha guttulata TaxID=1690604 RepID=UPI002DDF9DCB|nr:Tuberous sclerosis 2-like protein [Lithohypha guttulata]
MSVGHQLNGTTSRSASKSNISDTSSQSDQKYQPPFVSPHDLEDDVHQYDHSGHELRAWLSSFGDLDHRSDGTRTDVSRRFRLDEYHYPLEEPYSMLPMLASQLRLWFDTRVSNAQERSDVVWLLHYISDYIELGHVSLDADEVCGLCTQLLYVCYEARYPQQIEGCLAIFLSIAKAGHFPRKCLKEVLAALSSAVVILEKPLARLPECVQILASGPLAKDTIFALYSQMLAVTRNHDEEEDSRNTDMSRKLASARGAARHLSRLLEVTVPEGGHIIDVPQLLQTIRQMAEAKFIRLATEILVLLYHLLRSSRVEELVQAQHTFAILLDIFDVCRDSTIVPDLFDSTSKSKSRQEENIARERRYKKDLDKSATEFLGALSLVLPQMETDHASRAWRHIRAGDYLRAEARAGAIQYIREQKICIPGQNANWYEELQLLIARVLIGNPSHRSDVDMERALYDGEQVSDGFIAEQALLRMRQRIEVLHLCMGAIRSCPFQTDETAQELPATMTPLEAGAQALQKLLTIVNSEPTGEVVRVFLDELIDLCTSSTDGSEPPYASVIIEALLHSTLTNAPADNTAGSVYCKSTEALRSIFVQSLATTTNVPNQVFQALLQIADYRKSGTIYIERSSGSAYMASALCKTDESLRAMFSETDTDNQDLRGRSRKMLEKQLWMYPREAELVETWLLPENPTVHIKGIGGAHNEHDLDIADWIYLIHTNLLNDKDWETYSYAIVHFGSQLINTCLFEQSQEYLASLRGFLAGRVREKASMFEPPKDTGLDRDDVALCVYHILERLIPYAKMQPPSQNYESSRRGVDLVRAFRAGIGENLYEGTARSCIHALSLCCFETPEAIGTEYPSIVTAMMQKISQPHLLVHILEFLAQVARLPHLHRHFMDDEIKQIFGICISALNRLRSTEVTNTMDQKRISAHARTKGGLLTPYRAAMLKEEGLTQYSCALAYHTMIFWFLSIPLPRRNEKIKDIIPPLIRTDPHGQGNIDQQTVVLIDMMQRTAFSDLADTARDESFSGDDYERTTFIDGNAIITIETHRTNGRSQITKRQASGTTHAVFTPLVQELTSHHDRAFRDFPDRARPSHTFLNMIGSAIPIALPEQPLKLNPNESYVSRGMSVLDRTPVVDSHAIGVIILKNGQMKESEYLANTTGTPAFESFLDSIGTRVSLHPPVQFIPFNLIPSNEDGPNDGDETVAWRDRINEIVYQVSSLMPNTEDEWQTRKKSHLGNCNVLIIFNQSNKPWKWEQFQSQVTMVNIVITPVNWVSNQQNSDDVEHEFFTVEVLTKGEHQNISAAAEKKVVSRTTLAQLVRLLALNANIFSGCAKNESIGDAEFPSAWRSRLQQIVQLKERTQQRVLDNEDTLAKRYDFNRWT